MDLISNELTGYKHENAGFEPENFEPSFAKKGTFSGDTEGARGAAFLRQKTALRMKYEAEVEVLKRKIGDLEECRRTLGLSQRKMAQLLWVDPSAWSRWTQGGQKAPPHVYRALQWYLALEEKYPAMDINFWLQGVSGKIPGSDATERILVDLQGRIDKLENELEESRRNQIPKAAESATSATDVGLAHSHLVKRKWLPMSFAIGILLGAFLVSWFGA